jgi:ferrous iron transport protein A
MHTKIIPLTQLETGREAKVVELRGGKGMVHRLESRGIRPGLAVRKTSDQLMRGPVTVRVGHTTLAIGHGIAGRVMVEVRE